jgi:predicted DNA-binding transcriptional regulator AlpA
MTESKPWDNAELAQAAGVDDSYIRKLCIAGKFPNAFKIGNAWAIPREEGQAWLDKRREKLKN